ncbi:MAG: rhodanese-like domain-containing protein [candidate division WOR-3 bacterium]|nr:MAG: rhodanese-like domain-containing protein [candidate division WOR-3 bacterium]
MMKSAIKFAIIAIAIMALPAFLNAQCTGKCDGTCLKTEAEAFVKSVPQNNMYLLSIEDLATMVDEGRTDFVVLDIRPPKQYESGHIRGAMNVPLPMIVNKLDSIPSDKKIAVVCSFDTNSAFAVAVLRMNGRDAWIVEGGVYAWEGLDRKLVN